MTELKPCPFCFRVNWMTSILAGFSVVNVGMPWEGEKYD